MLTGRSDTLLLCCGGGLTIQSNPKLESPLFLFPVMIKCVKLLLCFSPQQNIIYFFSQFTLAFLKVLLSLSPPSHEIQLNGITFLQLPVTSIPVYVDLWMCVHVPACVCVCVRACPQ